MSERVKMENTFFNSANPNDFSTLWPYPFFKYNPTAFDDIRNGADDKNPVKSPTAPFFLRDKNAMYTYFEAIGNLLEI